MKNQVVRSITFNALVAAIYFLLTFITSPFAFLGMQVRVAEALVLLCFFRKDFTFGLTIGCLLANLLSPLGVVDVAFGTLATLVSCLGICFMKQLAIATLIPVVVNGFVVGAELYFVLQEPFWINVGFVALGEFIAVSILGYWLFFLLGKRPEFLKTIGANQNLNFVF